MMSVSEFLYRAACSDPNSRGEKKKRKGTRTIDLKIRKAEARWE